MSAAASAHSVADMIGTGAKSVSVPDCELPAAAARIGEGCDEDCMGERGESGCGDDVVMGDGVRVCTCLELGSSCDGQSVSEHTSIEDGEGGLSTVEDVKSGPLRSKSAAVMMRFTSGSGAAAVAPAPDRTGSLAAPGLAKGTVRVDS